jgi:hypothetical protein
MNDEIPRQLPPAPEEPGEPRSCEWEACDSCSAEEYDGEFDPLEARDPDDVISPPPFRNAEDFAPIPPPRASLADVVELGGHMVFVLIVTVLLPLIALWGMYRLYRWLPFETMALLIVSAAALWAYRDRIGPQARRLLFGRRKG